MGKTSQSLNSICIAAVLMSGFALAQTPVGSARAQIPLTASGLHSPIAHPSVAQEPGAGQPSVHAMLAPYWNRSLESRSALPPAALSAGPEVSIPPAFSPWWEPIIAAPTQPSSLAVGVDELLQAALLHSPHVRAVSIEPNIRDTYLLEEGAVFDWNSFLETGYADKNDPVGNELTTGNNDDRFKDRNWNASGGFRRTNEQGGEWELAQRLGGQRNNSRFLSPNPQGTARLELNYTHPLMNGAGRYYNRSRIVLADIDTRRSRDEVTRQLQDHLVQVTEAYWDLYRARSRYVQRVTLYQAAEQVLQTLVGRQEVDVISRQVLRVKAAVANRRAEIARAAAQIDNAQSQLRFLVNDPALAQVAELTPQVSPLMTRVDVSLSDSLATALLHQPEIAQAIRTLDANSIRLGVARNELLPKLDLLMSTYVAGLEGGGRSLSAWNNQFNDGRPGFSAGLLWELPHGNRAARAREERRRLELQQAASQFENTVETWLTVVEIAVREVDTSYREMVSRYQAIRASAEEISFLSDRYATLPGLNDSATLLLEDFLDAQARQADEEANFVDAQINYSLSLVHLRKAMGTLLQSNSASSQPIAHAPQLGPLDWESANLPSVPEDGHSSRRPDREMELPAVAAADLPATQEPSQLSPANGVQQQPPLTPTAEKW